MSTREDTGVMNLRSPFTAAETTSRVVDVLQQAGMRVFARIDQQAAAASAGLSMRPMVLVLFGDPKTGTPLMEAHPTLAIDLPLKALVWEDANGEVWVSTDSPDYLKRRHEMAQTPFTGVPGLLERAIQ